MLGAVNFINMKMILVIHEKDLNHKEQIVIGVADSIENAEKMINEYYGEYKEISYNDIEGFNLEYSKLLEVKGVLDELYKVEIWLEWFPLNFA